MKQKAGAQWNKHAEIGMSGLWMFAVALRCLTKVSLGPEALKSNWAESGSLLEMRNASSYRKS